MATCKAESTELAPELTKKDNQNQPLSSWNNTRRQYFATFVVNLLSISYGAFCGWTSPSLPFLESDETSLPSGPISIEISSWIGSMLCIGGLTGNFVFGYFLDKIGPKKILYIVAVPQIVAWLLIVFAQNSYYLIISRFITGLSIGGILNSLPTFVSEISQDHIRGQLGSFLVFCCNFGLLSAYICGTFLRYDVIPWVFLPLLLVFLILFWNVPESPTFLMRKHRYDEALLSFKYYRGFEKKSVDGDVSFKLENISNESEEHSDKITWKDFSSKAAKKSTLIGVVLMVTNQLCGCFAMLNYTASIFAESGSSFSPNVSSIIVGMIQMVGAYISVVLVEKTGRKMLLVVSLFGTSLGLLSFGAYSHLKHLGFEMTSINWIPLFSFSFTIFIANWGIMTIPFLVLSELVPIKIKGFVTSLCMGILWFFAFLMIKYLSALIILLKMHGTMYVFAWNSLLGAIFLIFMLPETKGKSFEEILKVLER